MIVKFNFFSIEVFCPIYYISFREINDFAALAGSNLGGLKEILIIHPHF
jgi:hypothetical protein